MDLDNLSSSDLDYGCDEEGLASLRKRLKGAVGSFNGACPGCLLEVRHGCVLLSLRQLHWCMRMVHARSQACLHGAGPAQAPQGRRQQLQRCAHRLLASKPRTSVYC